MRKAYGWLLYGMAVLAGALLVWMMISVIVSVGTRTFVIGGMLVAFAYSARWLGRGTDPNRLAAYGALVGIVAFALVAIVSALQVLLLFAAGVVLIGFSGRGSGADRKPGPRVTF